MATRPLVTPEVYSGEGPFDAWTDHFENVSTLNGWDDKQQAQWLAVRLVGRAQLAFKNLSPDAKASYKIAKEALTQRFELECKRGLYAAEFYARLKHPSEDWATFGEEIKALVDKAFPDLDDAARDRLAVAHFLTQLNDPQLAFSVRQAKPKTLEEVITATLEMQSHLQLATRTLPAAASGTDATVAIAGVAAPPSTTA